MPQVYLLPVEATASMMCLSLCLSIFACTASCFDLLPPKAAVYHCCASVVDCWTFVGPFRLLCYDLAAFCSVEAVQHCSVEETFANTINTD